MLDLYICEMVDELRFCFKPVHGKITINVCSDCLTRSPCSTLPWIFPSRTSRTSGSWRRAASSRTCLARSSTTMICLSIPVWWSFHEWTNEPYPPSCMLSCNVIASRQL
ncbi:hypothetical protein L226DRAFT_140687 [Lentinus tigrinus ALCF2SS1-7]|uniref:uncharacterized protein n=1 Tax=Lentinus tigrinus ALCF2SS1-7 TaxID=1328758 RepID=UPI001165D6CD|nr:hypothetical protein L226DRAFT_140687 [Lentinus tigrinus ALCF2SS1-7]